MDADDRAVIGARHMVLRMLIAELYEALLQRRADPIGDSEKWSKLMLDAMDKSVDGSSMPDVFKHTALHEMETFWQGLQQAIAARVEFQKKYPER